jgi:hypothetical protein
MQLLKVTDANVASFGAMARHGKWVVCHYMNGCMHCEMMKPAWKEAKAAVKGVDDLNIAEVEYRFTSKLPERMRNVLGYPSFVSYTNGVPDKELSGMRTVENLTRFLLDNVDTKKRARKPSAKPKAAATKKAK